jgi:hypothetical protein
MLIVSMATIASRVAFLPEILTALERQTVKPDKILIHYSSTPWHLDAGIKVMPPLNCGIPVTCRLVENVGSARKYLFALDEYKGTDTWLLFMDDDLVFGREVVASLYGYAEMQDCAVSTRGWSQYRMVPGLRGEMLFDNIAIQSDEISRPTEVFVANSGWGTLVNVSHVDARILDAALHQRYMLPYSDEIFLSSMINRRKMIVPLEKGFYHQLSHEYSGQWISQETGRAKLRQLELIHENRGRNGFD